MFEFLKKWSPFGPRWSAEEPEPQDFSSAQLIIMRPLEQQNFNFTKNFIIERVAWPDPSKQFVKDFTQTCRLLKKHKHPAILELVDFWNESRLLYRIWKRRKVYPACISTVTDHKSLITFIEGLQHLNKLGFSYSYFSSDCFSIDETGPFTIKIPYTLDGAYAEALNQPVFRSPHSHYYVHPNSQATDEEAWLYALGGILCPLLKQGFPFNGIPMFLARERQPITKHPMAIEGPVGEVLNRFLATNEEEPYQSIEEGLGALKEALQNTPEIRYNLDVPNTWEDADNSIVLPHEVTHEWMKFSPEFSSN